MKKLQDRLDPKYVKICSYVCLTVLITFILLRILSYSGDFWRTLWTMFTAILKPIIIGGIISYLFMPVVERIEHLLSKEDKPWRRPAAVAIFYISVALILALIILALFFAVKGGINELMNLDFEAIKDFLLSLSDQFSKEIESIQEKMADTDLPIGKAGDLLTGFINSVAGFFSGLLFGVIFSIYFMLDGKNLKKYWLNVCNLIFGDKCMAYLSQIASDADSVFSGYIRGQFIDAVIVGTCSSILLLLAGVPYAVVIGILMGIGNLIPYVGPVVGYGATAIICLIMGQFDKLIIGILIIAVIMFVDGNVVNPKLLSSNIEVHPLLVIAALLAGGALGGFVGMLVAVPCAALLKLQFERYLEFRNKARSDTLQIDEPPEI